MRNKLLSLALAISIIGLLLISIAAQVAEPVASSISNLSSMKEGTYASVFGIVRSIIQRSGGYTVVVCESKKSQDCISASVSTSAMPRTLVEGDYVTVKGMVQSYAGRMSLSVTRESDIEVFPLQYAADNST